jgi:elongation factor P
MITTGDLKKGSYVRQDGELLRILDWQHVKQGRGSAFVRIQFRNIVSGANVERTFQAGSKFEDFELERRHAQYQYKDDDLYHFMDTDSYEQLSLTEREVGNARYFIRENDVVDIMMFEGRALDIELPTGVVLTIAATEPGVRGDTASAATKPARTDTGLTVNVPLFLNVGDRIKVDTRTNVYIERVS